MLNINQFRSLIIKPACENLMLYSKDAEELLVFTCATESMGGTFLKQENDGPALGIYQMEPATYNDLWQNYLKNHQNLMSMLIHNFDCIMMPDEKRLMYDLWFATAMARLHYARIKVPLPNADDVNAIWDYYKEFYNTYEGKAEHYTSIARYRMFIAHR